ncbi:MAG: glycosyltransferase family 4 protein [Gammaproteobacteria bacterium]|nr:glycosyltransferase family 4 protein [Pseudomonadales bacterium]
MKVLHVVDYLPGIHEHVGGAEFVAQRMILEQEKLGIEIEIATLPADFNLPNPPWKAHYEYGNLDQYLGKASYAVKQMFKPNDPIPAARLQSIIQHSKPDIVHYHNLHFSGLSVLTKARAAGIPSFKSIYDYWIFCPSNMLLTSSGELCKQGQGAHCVDCVGKRRLRALKPLKRHFFDKRKKAFGALTGQVDRFMVLSEASRDLMIHQGISPDKIVVVPQYIWEEAEKSRIVDDPVPGRLVYVGWIDERKGLHVVVDAFLQLADEFPELHIEILGLPASESYKTAIQSKLNASGHSSRVNFRGRISRSDLLSELSKAFLVTVPEQWENMSPVILTESMAAGACPLASRVGGIKYFIEDNVSGLLAERDDPTDWATHIRYAMNNRSDILAMRQAAKDRARYVFDPKTINETMLRVYEEAIEQGQQNLNREWRDKLD